MNFNHYFTNEELAEVLQSWAASHPNLVSLGSLGESYEKLPIPLLTLTNKATGGDTEKPAVWIDANIHATEVAGTTTALHIAHTLLEGYSHDSRLTRLLDAAVYYIAPRLNPDGAALALADRPRFLRSGVRPYPWEEKDAGLHPQDIDGDGRILQMRVPDPNGDWKVSPLDARLMAKRLPHEHGGRYYRLLPEGLIEDWDGYLIKLARPVEGLDFNRNFPFEWRPEGDQQGAGPFPASEPEIRALAAFVTAHPNINFAVTYHTFSRAILRPYSTRPDEAMETEDLWVFQRIGQIGTEMTGYRCVSTFHDFKYHPKETTSGAFDDWLFDHFGAFTFTVEQWDLPSEAGIQDRKFMDWFRAHPHEEDLQILKWADEHAGPGAYVSWYPYEHPQLGLIELGGWNVMYTWRNPPAGCMQAEAERNTPFALALGDMLPRLSVHTLEITPMGVDEPHGADEWSVNLVVENAGFLPTFTSAQGKKRQAVRPVRVLLELPDGAELVTGRRRVELGHLEGRSNKLDVDPLWGSSPTDNRARAEWVVRAPAGSTLVVKITSERAGTIKREVRLAVGQPGSRT